MSKKEFPDTDRSLDPQPGEKSVDFSDLGPLFQPENDSEKDSAGDPDQQEESVTFQPLEEETVPSGEIFPEDVSLAQEEEAIFLPEDPSSEDFSQDGPADTVDSEVTEPSVDFSDLGPLFQAEPGEDASVHAGEAALVLKKLSELTPQQASEEDPETAPEKIPEEIPEEADEAHLCEEEPAPETVSPSMEEAVSKDPEAPETSSEAFFQESEDPEEISAPVHTSEEAPSDTVSEETESQPEEAEENESSQPEEISESPAEESAPYSRPLRKGRPKRKKGEGFFGIPNLLVTIVWIAITILIGVTLGRMAWLCAADVLAFGREDKPVTITVYEADTIEDITRKLHEAGLIHYPGLFKFYASLAVDEGEIHPGIWDLNTRYDYHALVNMMSPSSSREVIELMIPEGYSCRQIFDLMEENKICTALDLGAYAAAGELDDYWFLEEVERGDMYCLEGFLFPDTYQFYKNDSPRAVLTKMLDNFGYRFDEAMTAQIDELNAHLADLMRKGGHGDEFIAENVFTVRDVINVASLIEKETSSADEGYVIASVIYNRLFNWPDNVPYLNIDATIVYALGGKNKLTSEDLKVNSPYNTYTHTGLTPGPIANPGLSSIRAALAPADSNYYYYVLDPALGSHRFSTTYDEHKANIASIGE